MIFDHRDRPSTFNTAVCGEPKEFTYRECWNEDGYETHKFNMTETGVFPFYKNSDASFKEGYMCAMEFVKMSYCRKCGEKNPLLDVQYQSRKWALDKNESLKSRPDRMKTLGNSPRFNAHDGKPLVDLSHPATRVIKMPWQTYAKETPRPQQGP